MSGAMFSAACGKRDGSDVPFSAINNSRPSPAGVSGLSCGARLSTNRASAAGRECVAITTDSFKPSRCYAWGSHRQKRNARAAGLRIRDLNDRLN